jgi:hypothetical protein
MNQSASWEGILEGTPGGNPYKEGALPTTPSEPEAEDIKEYYTHPKFSLMPRTIHKG